jgi:hypothetical protein
MKGLINYIGYIPFLLALVLSKICDSNKNLIYEKNIRNTFIVLSVISFIIYIYELYYSIMSILKKNIKLEDIFIIIQKLLFYNILTFALIYFTFYIHDDSNFFGMNKIYGIDEDTNMNNFLIHKLITMVYFSIHTFFSLGFGDIYPSKLCVRFINALQMLFSYITTSYLFIRTMRLIER